MSRKIIRYVCLVALMFFVFKFSFIIVKLFRSNNDFQEYPKITNTYSYLLNDKAISLLKPSYSYYNKFKNPIATYQFINGKGQIIIYKIDNFLPSSSLKDILNLKITDGSQRTPDVVYNGSFKNDFFRFNDANQGRGKSNKLFIDINGEVLGKPVLQDSLIDYHLNLNNFSGRSDRLGIVDFFIEKRNMLSSSFNIDLLFVKKDKSIYMILKVPDGKPELNLLNLIN